MLQQYDNALLASTFLWTQNRVESTLAAWTGVTLPLYYGSDPSLPPGLLNYASSYRGWVYNSGVSGAPIIQNVTDGINVYDRSSGFIFDYVNGRVLVPSGYGTGLLLTGTMAVSLLNVYQPNETEEFILTQSSRFYFNPRYNGVATGGLPPYAMCTPALFVNTLHSLNDAFAIGGLNDTTTVMSILVYAESNYQLTALLSSFRDSRYDYVPLLQITQDPLNQWGDTYSGYNYQTYINQYGTPGNLIYIKSIATSKVSDRVKTNPNYFIGLVDLTMSFVRTTI